MTTTGEGIDLDKIDLAVVLYVLAMGAIIAIVVYAVLRAGQLPQPMPLMVALSVVTIIALAGYVLTEDAPLATIAATGVGALAGALSATFTATKPDDEPPLPEE
jgi:FtsH-binding integral membrane protein